MESACRHYTAALEALLGPDGILETTASWSPRWEEARVLADMVAMRILRCLLWSNLTTTAVQSWSNYRYRLQELVDRRGKGSSNYGWEAWEARWLRMMAELVKRAQLSVFAQAKEEEFTVYAPVEKAIPIGERIRPFDHLHHPGYWLRIAAKHSRRRRRFAQELPEEDCIPPGQSPASAMASRYGTYDTYLCPEPWQERPNPERKTYNHSKDIFRLLEKAKGHFRVQLRSRSELSLDMARELMRNNQYPEAMKTLYHLWVNMSWRKDQWWDLVFEVTRNLKECAKLLGDTKVLAAAEFELYSKSLPRAKNHTYDLLRCGEGVTERIGESMIESDVVKLDEDKVASFLSTSFTFGMGEGNAGEPLRTQLVITSRAQPGSIPVVLERVDIALSGQSFGISLKHSDAQTENDHQIQELTLEEDSSGRQDQAVMIATADLRLKEGKTVVYEFPLIFREAGPISVENIVFSISTPASNIRYTSTPKEHGVQHDWYNAGPRGLMITTPVAREVGHKVHIRPRPPKMEIKLPNIGKHFYTDEEIELQIEILNNEDETTESSLEVRLLTDGGLNEFEWSGGDAGSSPSENLPGRRIGTLDPGTSKYSGIVFTAPGLPTSYVVEVKVLYHLLSDPSTPISKIFTADLNVTRAFEANYEFQPRVHPDPWPSFFSSAINLETENSGKHGIVQRWELLARIASFTYEGVIMSSVELRQESISNPVNVTAVPIEKVDSDTEVAPQQQIDRSFIIDVTKTSLEDRRPVELELVLAISWHRPRSAKKFTSLLPVNSFVLENGPRVLAAVSSPEFPGEDKDENISFAQLTFTLENPTNHFLTFELTMEGPQKEDWALSGMKMRSLNLLPLSREAVSYRIIPLATDGNGIIEGGKWLEIKLRVMDVYFRKVLRCLPASHRVREAEEKGGSLMIWDGGEGF
jgi:solute carrier family 25 protein 38